MAGAFGRQDVRIVVLEIDTLMRWDSETRLTRFVASLM